MGAFLLGVVSSVVASFLVLMLTNREDLRYFLSSRGRYKNLSGNWMQYHLSTDSAVTPIPIWVKHDARIKLTAFGHVRGRSESSYNESYRYAVTGSIRNGVMRLRLDNISAIEEPAFMIFPNLLTTEALVGIWTGQDFDQQWTSGPVILSREKLEMSALSRYAQRQRNLGITTFVRHYVRYFPGEVSSAWHSDVGRRTIESLPDTTENRMVIAGVAYEDGTGKLLFGPQERLPLIGHYKVMFHLAYKNLDRFAPDDKLVRLDVYGDDHALAQRFMSATDLDSGYRWYELFFEYTNLALKLEYRIALLRKGLAGSVYDVTVEKIGDIQRAYPPSSVLSPDGNDS
ncbi:MAG TPA: hypothetical protein VIY52_19540 [Streptosporangiaceae bacterium]